MQPHRRQPHRRQTPGSAFAAAFGLILLVASAAHGDTPVVFSATGADVPAAVAAFRNAIGGVNNGNAREMQASGRREINWEEVPDSASSPNPLPEDFYYRTVPRLAQFISSAEFPVRVSAAPGNAAGTPTLFGDIDPAYPTRFAPYSGQRLAAATAVSRNSQPNQFSIYFSVPGTTGNRGAFPAPATVSAVGIVFTDVNLPNVTSIRVRADLGFTDLGTYYVPPTSGHGQMSFLGVVFPTPQVAWVDITLGTAALATGNTLEDSTHDLVAMDDVIYSEPQAQSYTISDATVQEGQSGTTDAVFTVTRSSLTLPTAMGYFLTAGTATQNVDYLDLNGDRSVRFAPGSYTSTITVKVVGDQDVEPNETFLVHLDYANAFVSTKSVGLGTIVDDDPGGAPSLTITQPTAASTFSASRPFVTVAGSTLSTQPVTAVTWANDRGGSGTASGTTNWTIPNLALQPGVNQITVAATDAIGNTATNAITVNAAPSYYLAEGSTGPFFDYDLSIANPNDSSAPVTLTFLRDDGTTVSSQATIGALSQTTLHVDSIPGLESTAMSTVVTSSSGLPLVVERTMFWDHTYYGGSAAVAVSAPRTEWRFAEGVENGFFDTFVLLENPNPQPTTVTVAFLLEATPPVAPVSVNLTLAPQSRTTLDAGSVAGLAGYSFGIAVSGSLPIVAERATYFGSTPTLLWDGGDGSPGVTDPASTWLFAEGATGPATDTFFVVANNDTVAQPVTFTFFLDTGEVVTKVKTIPAQSRYTMPVDTEDPRLANATFATQITGSPQIVAEREMYWRGTSSPYTDSTSVFGVNAPGTKWGFAEGRVGGPLDFHSYILLGNMNATPADVTVTYLRTDGTTIAKTYSVGATSRVTVDVGMTSGLRNESFGTIVESTNGVPIVTERAMYWTPGSILFDGAIATTGTRLQ